MIPSGKSQSKISGPVLFSPTSMLSRAGPGVEKVSAVANKVKDKLVRNWAGSESQIMACYINAYY